ncbi:ATP-binding protein [Bacteriovoracaceae bacterium]|nr:ATP-binding protein [Bacteriovoracaceae bacterium]
MKLPSSIKNLFYLDFFRFHKRKTNTNPEIIKIKESKFKDEYQKLVEDCDKVFVLLMFIQWAFCIFIAYAITPMTYIGTTEKLHFHVYMAIYFGGALTLAPFMLYLYNPGGTLNRYVNVICQGLFSAMIIHLTGGRIDTHFHVFGSLAFFAFYRDVKVLLVGTAVVAIDHLVRGVWFPLSVFGIAHPSQWRWLEHAAWVVFEDFFLVYACLRSMQEMKITAESYAEVEFQKSIEEEKVKDRTAELDKEKKSMELILNSVDQGLVAVDFEGNFVGNISEACKKILQTDISGKNIKDVLLDTKTDWEELLGMIKEEAIPLDSLFSLLPSELNLNQKYITIEYGPIYEGDNLTSLLLVFSDITERKLFEDQKNQEIVKNQALVKILSAKSDFMECFDLVESLKVTHIKEVSVKRILHTLKGALAYLDLKDLSQLCHDCESEFIEQGFSEELLNQCISKIETGLNSFIEENNKILKIDKNRKVIEIKLEELNETIKDIGQVSSNYDLVAKLDNLMMTNLEDEFNWLNEAYLKTGEKLMKELNPIQFVSDSKIISYVYNDLFKSLLHLVKNVVDHGIETPDIREMIGKEANGNLKITMSEDEKFYNLEFKDDGNGIDLEKIKSKLTEKNLPIPEGKNDLINMIFKDEFSTADKVTDLSGRGVGLAAIKEELEKFDGSIICDSVEGEGSTFKLKFKKFSYAQKVLEEKSSEKMAS